MPDWERLAKSIHAKAPDTAGKAIPRIPDNFVAGRVGVRHLLSTPAIGYRCERCKPARALAVATPDNADRPCATENCARLEQGEWVVGAPRGRAGFLLVLCAAKGVAG